MTSTETTTQRPEAIHDERLAALYMQEQKLLQKLAMYITQSQHMTGGKVEYDRNGRGYTQWMRDTKAEGWRTPLTPEVAYERLSKIVADSDPDDGGYGKVDGKSFYDTRGARETLAKLDSTRTEIARVRDEYNQLDAAYTGWSRFFLVTSSRGHVHSSMRCSSCNKGKNLTTFGWLPNLSGQTEQDAVDELGPNLCSVCFPSAPVEWVGGWITKAQAEKKAAA